MKLRFLLNRRQAESLPLLPVSEPEDAATVDNPRGEHTRAEREERLERLLTPRELELVQHHRL